MAEPFSVRVAGLVVEVHPLFDELRALCEGYVVGTASDDPVAAGGVAGGFAGDVRPEPDLSVRVTPADIAHERELSPDDEEWADDYLETLVVLRRIAEFAPSRDTLLMHGAVIEYDGRAYLFTAPSGTGKSTHIRLWRRFLGDAVQVVNGDKPLVRFESTSAAARRGGVGAAVLNGAGGAAVPDACADARCGGAPVSPSLAVPIAYGTPWCGKEGWQRNVGVPIAGVCFLGRCAPGESAIRRISPAESLDRLFRQTYLPQDAAAAAQTMELLDRLLAAVPVYDLRCDMSEDAVSVSFEGLTGKAYASGRGAVAGRMQREG